MLSVEIIIVFLETKKVDTFERQINRKMYLTDLSITRCTKKVEKT